MAKKKKVDSDAIGLPDPGREEPGDEDYFCVEWSTSHYRRDFARYFSEYGSAMAFADRKNERKELLGVWISEWGEFSKNYKRVEGWIYYWWSDDAEKYLGKRPPKFRGRLLGERGGWSKIDRYMHLAPLEKRLTRIPE